jgi:enoyl-CoA hydratase/carnithine racemase
MNAPGEVRYRKQGAVGHILVDRPQARNAMTPDMYAQLDAACAAIATDAELRCVVLRGAGGKSFVSGSDIAQFLAFESAEDGVDYERRMERHLDNIAGIEVPVVAVIEGFAVGGGLNMAACCDIRIATTGSKFGTPIAKGLGNCLSAANYARLLHAVGEGRARRMLLLGELLEVDDMLPTGFLSRVVDADALEATVDEVVGQLVLNSPLSMRASKAALARISAPQVAEIEDMIRLVYGSADFHDAVQAFVEKRKPVFRGE